MRPITKHIRQRFHKTWHTGIRFTKKRIPYYKSNHNPLLAALYPREPLLLSVCTHCSRRRHFYVYDLPLPACTCSVFCERFLHKTTFSKDTISNKICTVYRAYSPCVLFIGYCLHCIIPILDWSFYMVTGCIYFIITYLMRYYSTLLRYTYNLIMLVRLLYTLSSTTNR